MAKNLCDTSPQGRLGSQPTSSYGTNGKQTGNTTDARDPNIPKGGSINVPVGSAGATSKTRQNEQTKKGPAMFGKGKGYRY